MLGTDLDPLRLPHVLAPAPRLYPSLAAVLALCAACGEGNRGEVPERPIAGPRADTVTDGPEVDLDVLRALPYAGYREEASGEEPHVDIFLHVPKVFALAMRNTYALIRFWGPGGNL